MTCKVLALQQLNKIVWQANQVKHWPPITPVQSSGMDVTVHQSMLMQVSHCTGDLAEDEQQSGHTEDGLAELLPEE